VKRAALTLCLVVAALGAWLLWPRGAPGTAALELPTPDRPAEAPVAPSAELQSQLQTSLRNSNQAPAALAEAPAAATAPTAGIEPGTIEGIVVRRSGENETPIEGALVELWSPGVIPPAEPSEERWPQAVTHSLADGTFRFTQLWQGGFTLRAQLRSGPWCQFGAYIPERGPGARAKLVFGGGRIHGRVHDLNGGPFAACHVQISSDQSRASGDAHGAPRRTYLRTDALGEFAFEDLPADQYSLILSAPGKVAEQGWPGRFTKVQLAEAEDVCLDAGSPRGAAHWRGRLRTRGGAAVESTGKLGFDCTELSARGSKIETHVDVRLIGTSAFDAPLEPRTWSVDLAFGPSEYPQPLIGSREVSAAGLDEDIVLPGSRLTGTVFDARTHEPLDGTKQFVQVLVYRDAKSSSGTSRMTHTDAHGRYAIDMLGAGDWLVVTSPWTVSPAGGGRALPLHLAEGEYEHTLDLEVRKP
jgi:hypothetical protein